MKRSAKRARTSRTYPIAGRELVRAIESTILGWPSWELERSDEGEIRAHRPTRCGSDEVRIRLVALESGAHTNTLAKFESGSTSSLPRLGQSQRNLDRLTTAVEEYLRPDA